MKNLSLIIGLAMAVLATSALAAVEDGLGSRWNVGTGDKWSTELGKQVYPSLYVSNNNTVFTATEDATLTFDLIKGMDQSATFGVYTYTLDANGQVVNKTDIGTSTLGVGGESFSVDVKSGAMVGFYVVDSSSTADNQNRIESGSSAFYANHTFAGELAQTALEPYLTKDGREPWTLSFDDTQGNAPSRNWSNQWNPGYDYMIVVRADVPTAAGSSGAPLPGVLATIALCGTVCGYVRRRSQKRKDALK